MPKKSTKSPNQEPLRYGRKVRKVHGLKSRAGTLRLKSPQSPQKRRSESLQAQAVKGFVDFLKRPRKSLAYKSRQNRALLTLLTLLTFLDSYNMRRAAARVKDLENLYKVHKVHKVRALIWGAL